MGRETVGMWRPLKKRGRETEELWAPMGKRYKEGLKETDGKLWTLTRIVRAIRNPWNRVYKRNEDWVFQSGWDPTKGKKNQCSQCIEPKTDYMVHPVMDTEGESEY